MTPATLHLPLPDAAATQRLGYALGLALRAGTVLLLSGDLGSGKTTLVQGLGLGLGITDAVDSPTFTLVNEYFEGRLPLYHLDLYRLDPAEVAALHVELYWDPSETRPGIVAIEWSDRLPERPPEYLELELCQAAEGGREVRIRCEGLDLAELQAQLGAIAKPD